MTEKQPFQKALETIKDNFYDVTETWTLKNYLSGYDFWKNVEKALKICQKETEKKYEEKIQSLGGCPHIVNWDECFLICKHCVEKLNEKLKLEKKYEKKIRELKEHIKILEKAGKMTGANSVPIFKIRDRIKKIRKGCGTIRDFRPDGSNLYCKPPKYCAECEIRIEELQNLLRDDG